MKRWRGIPEATRGRLTVGVTKLHGLIIIKETVSLSVVPWSRMFMFQKTEQLTEADGETSLFLRTSNQSFVYVFFEKNYQVQVLF